MDTTQDNANRKKQSDDHGTKVEGKREVPGDNPFYGHPADG
jgi:hypothetical protein